MAVAAYFLAGQDLQQGGKTRPQILAVHDAVQEPVGQVGLSGVGIGGERLVRDFAEGPQGGEADQGTWFGEDDVGQVGEAGVSLPGGGVGEDGDEGKALVLQPVGGADSLGHLHQGEDAFLQPSTSAGDQGHDGQIALGGGFKGQGDLFAHHASHTAAHEPEIEDDQHDFS